MPESDKAKLGTFSAPSIGIGRMVAGAIFAMTGLNTEITRGSRPSLLPSRVSIRRYVGCDRRHTPQNGPRIRG